MQEIAIFIVGLFAGAAAAYFIMKGRQKQLSELALESARQANLERLSDYQGIFANLKDSFYSVSLEALDKNIKNFLEMAKTTLSEQTAVGMKDIESKKDAIFQTCQNIKEEVNRLRDQMGALDKDYRLQHGQISELMKTTQGQMLRLADITGRLGEALASAGARGQWGERMAEDVLKFAGFIEGINYFKQKSNVGGGRPDFTFPIPPKQKLFMDVKFPFDNYRSYLEASSEEERERLKVRFLKDVHSHIKTIADRNYAASDEDALDMVLLFVPNEQIFSFINQHDFGLIEKAISQKIIICSPMTLFAILVLIRRATENFNLEKTASQILILLGEFSRQWKAFIDSHEKVGKRIEQLQEDFGKLISTRKNQLQKPLDKIEELRRSRGLPAVAEADIENESSKPDKAEF